MTPVAARRSRGRGCLTPSYGMPSTAAPAPSSSAVARGQRRLHERRDVVAQDRAPSGARDVPWRRRPSRPRPRTPCGPSWRPRSPSSSFCGRSPATRRRAARRRPLRRPRRRARAPSGRRTCDTPSRTSPTRPAAMSRSSPPGPGRQVGVAVRRVGERGVDVEVRRETERALAHVAHHDRRSRRPRRSR